MVLLKWSFVVCCLLFFAAIPVKAPKPGAHAKLDQTDNHIYDYILGKSPLHNLEEKSNPLHNLEEELKQFMRWLSDHLVKKQNQLQFMKILIKHQYQIMLSLLDHLENRQPIHQYHELEASTGKEIQRQGGSPSQKSLENRHGRVVVDTPENEQLQFYHELEAPTKEATQRQLGGIRGPPPQISLGRNSLQEEKVTPVKQHNKKRLSHLLRKIDRRFRLTAET